MTEAKRRTPKGIMDGIAIDEHGIAHLSCLDLGKPAEHVEEVTACGLVATEDWSLRKLRGWESTPRHCDTCTNRRKKEVEDEARQKNPRPEQSLVM